VSLVDEATNPTVYTNGSDFWPKEWKQIEGGNPDLFTHYLRKELFPYLKEKYRANDFRIIIGLSGGSIYTLHTFIKEPDLFDAHIAIAAGDILGMGYREGERFIDLIVTRLNENPVAKGYLYITSADSDGGGNSPMIKANLEELNKLLTPHRTSSFKFLSKIFPNEGHYDVALPALEEALTLIFPKEKWFAKYRDIINKPGNAMTNIDAFYHELSSEYGFEVLPRAERWNSINRLSWIGPFLLRQGNTAEAIEVIERWVEYRPKSTLALSELAKAYESNGDHDKAISKLEKALEMSLDLKEKETFQIRINELIEKRSKGN
jgi:tetratricopeptide (TPR) repeat protein